MQSKKVEIQIFFSPELWIQCWKDQMQVSHVDKDMVEQSNTIP